MTALIALIVAAVVLAVASLRPGAPPPRPSRRPPRLGGPEPRPPVWFEELLAHAGVALDAVRAWAWVRWAAPLTVATLAITMAVPAALAAAGLVLLAPRALEPLLRRHRLDRRDEQLPAALERLASDLRAGSAPAPAIVALAATTAAPLGPELRAAATEIEHGAAVAEAVDRWAARPDASEAVRLAAAALGLGVDAGGEMAQSVDRIAGTLRERREVRAEVHALATQARASAGVLGLAPIAFTALVSTVEPEMVRFLVSTPIGLLCLAGGLSLDALGAAWMARIVVGAAI